TPMPSRRPLQGRGYRSAYEAVATGQFMLLRRSAYAAVGGHAAVRAALSEDQQLARLLKRRGFRVLLMDGAALLRARMYDGWRTLWPGLARNMMPVLGGPLRTALVAPAIAALAWLAVLLPLADALTLRHGAHAAALALAGSASAALLALHIAGAVHFRTAWWYGALFPIGYLLGALMALDSVRWRLTGRVQWRGRVYQS
ncbi:MAG: glycosyltransferase, partial [Steroidobacteraceae bacterium]